ncbi:hypothetical protein [Actinomycetospora chiangmaiensis]|uniref:hypothetical protein n=1 Tax=Actinomycetospora chiangmaiensis TaxID=402650 RepID=UPI00037893A6|nr:hypothetical protein [Actinomycetospora chiangmaiensis]
MTPSAPSVELFSHEGCPVVEQTRGLLRQCLDLVGLDDVPIHEHVGAYPSPTVVLDGRDVTGGPPPAAGVPRCRLDTPTREQLLSALRRAAPRR